MRLITALDYIVTLGGRTDLEAHVFLLHYRIENFFNKNWRETMKAQELVKQFAEEIEKAAQNEDVIAARNNVRKVAQRWKHESRQMFDDKENKIIFAGGVSAALLIGIAIGALFL